MKNKAWILFLVIGVASRFIPHLPNATAVSALALLSGSRLYTNSKLNLLLPLAVMLLTDTVLGFHSTMFWVYGSLLLISLLGYVYKDEMHLKSMWKYSLASSFLFYIVTNFGVWASTDMYSKTWSGLLECYTMAIPFFRYTVIGDLIYNFVVFGAYELVHSQALLFKVKPTSATISVCKDSSHQN